ncbi:MAG: hypothetical protein PF961_16335 [Planctomycetota bacterium]|jgi:hypothetical protein|nr:hypothetical protein [Planctomycetota bacterium]
MHRSHLLLPMAAILLTCSALGAAENLVPAGTFSSDRGRPAGWEAAVAGQAWARDKFSVVEEEGRSIARVESGPAYIIAPCPVAPEWGEVSLSVDLRLAGIKPGGKPWEVPFAEIDFLDASGQSLLDWKRSIWLKDNTEGWHTITRSYPVPAAAVTMVP